MWCCRTALTVWPGSYRLFNTVIMSHFVIDTGYPCVRYQGGKPKLDPDGGYEFDPVWFNANCDCNETDPDAAQWFTRDDLIAHPGDPAYPHYVETYGISQTTRLGDGDYSVIAKELALENNQYNCNVLKNGGSPTSLSANNLIIAEAFYDQSQLMGVPFISNQLTDPIPLYSHTAMRIVSSRDSDTTETVGPTCSLFPITFPEYTLDDPDNPTSGQIIDAYEGDSAGNFGWMYWNSAPSATTGINYIEEALINPYLSMNDYVADPSDPQNPDTSISINDHIAGRTGVGNSDTIDDYLEDALGSIVYVPVYEAVQNGGSNTYYEISHFARVRIDMICLPRNNCIDPNTGSKISGSDKLIRATFLDYADDICGPPDPS